MNFKNLRLSLVKLIYADHNNASIVQKKMKQCLNHLKKDDIGINIGAGTTLVHENVRNLDIFPGQNIFYVAKAEKIPEIDNFFTLAISQEVLEHVQNPTQACFEIHRVLKKGGIFYCQIPFIIGYHPGPTDYWRFTIEGIQELLKRTGFEIEEIGISVGAGTGYYRISVEFFAGLISIFIPKLYFISKGFFSIFLFPLKSFDFLFMYSKQKDRIPGGYYVIAKKK
jgi:SAM-dependent methyltransferase